MTRLSRLFPALLALVLLAAAPPASAQGAADAFTVRGIQVDVTAANVSAAKEQAIAEGQRKGFRQLLERLTAPADHSRLPTVDGIDYVRDFSVEQERSSAVRYLATLAVRYHPVAVRKLLRDSNIAYAEPRGRAVLVVPVFQGPARTVLWDDPNPWRAAWVALGGGGLVPLAVPAGDLADMQLISAEQALAGDAERMQALSEQYRGADVMVVAAALAPAGRALDVAVHASAGAPKPFDTVSYPMAEGETAEALMARAARDIQRAIETVHKQPNMLQFDRAGTLSALVPLSGLQDWLAVRDSLGRVSQVRRWELVSLSKAEAAVILHTLGDPEQVRAALARQGLDLEWTDGYWTMRPVGR